MWLGPGHVHLGSGLRRRLQLSHLLLLHPAHEASSAETPAFSPGPGGPARRHPRHTAAPSPGPWLSSSKCDRSSYTSSPRRSRSSGACACAERASFSCARSWRRKSSDRARDGSVWCSWAWRARFCVSGSCLSSVNTAKRSSRPCSCSFSLVQMVLGSSVRAATRLRSSQLAAAEPPAVGPGPG